VCDNDSSEFRDSVAGSGEKVRPRDACDTLALIGRFDNFDVSFQFFGDLVVSLTVSQCTSAHLYSSLSGFFRTRIGEKKEFIHEMTVPL